jgi:uncharacterized membrane protein (UPF0127 family)
MEKQIRNPRSEANVDSQFSFHLNHWTKTKKGSMSASIVNLCNSIIIANDLFPHADRARGMMFRRTLGTEQGIWMDMDCTTRILSSIHMMFVFFPLAVFWLDRHGVIVDKILARPFRLMYIPRAPARFVLELHWTKLGLADLGDKLALTAS